MFIVIRTPTWQSHTERIWNSWCHWQSTILKKIVICKLQSDLDIWIIHSNIQFGKFWKRKLIPKFYWWLHLYLWCVARFGKPATSLKVTFLHGCFSRFLNCTNGTKSRKTSHIKPVSSSTFTVYQDKIFQKQPLLGVLKNSCFTNFWNSEALLKKKEKKNGALHVCFCYSVEHLGLLLYNKPLL